MEAIYLTHCSVLPVLDAEPCVIALGFFDGVHIGHQHVIATAKQIAERRNVKLAVLTFSPHPKEVLSEGKTKMDYLTPMAAKEEIFSKLGVEKLYVIKFDLNFAKLPPEEFVATYVIGLKAVHVVAGFDFTYGYKGQGNMQTLSDEGKGKFLVTIVPKIARKEQKISSTFIRGLLREGDVESTASCLGDFYQTKGDVLLYTRDRNGGVRAEILTHPFYTLPAEGLYEIEAHIENYIYQGISHVRSGPEGTIAMEIKLSYLRKNIRKQTVKIKWITRLSGAKGAEASSKQYGTQ